MFPDYKLSEMEEIKLESNTELYKDFSANFEPGSSSEYTYSSINDVAQDNMSLDDWIETELCRPLTHEFKKNPSCDEEIDFIENRMYENDICPSVETGLKRENDNKPISVSIATILVAASSSGVDTLPEHQTADTLTKKVKNIDGKSIEETERAVSSILDLDLNWSNKNYEKENFPQRDEPKTPECSLGENHRNRDGKDSSLQPIDNVVKIQEPQNVITDDDVKNVPSHLARMYDSLIDSFESYVEQEPEPQPLKSDKPEASTVEQRASQLHGKNHLPKYNNHGETVEMNHSLQLRMKKSSIVLKQKVDVPVPKRELIEKIKKSCPPEQKKISLIPARPQSHKPLRGGHIVAQQEKIIKKHGETTKITHPVHNNKVDVPAQPIQKIESSRPPHPNKISLIPPIFVECGRKSESKKKATQLIIKKEEKGNANIDCVQTTTVQVLTSNGTKKSVNVQKCGPLIVKNFPKTDSRSLLKRKEDWLLNNKLVVAPETMEKETPSKQKRQSVDDFSAQQALRRSRDLKNVAKVKLDDCVAHHQSRKRKGIPLSKPSCSEGRSPFSQSPSRLSDRHQIELNKVKRVKLDDEERKVVFVGGIPDNTTKDFLRREFQHFGEIVEINTYFRQERDNYAFITFTNENSAHNAITCSKDVYPNLTFSFGQRRKFLREPYSDLDAVQAEGGRRVTASSYHPKVPSFDRLLRQQTTSQMKKHNKYTSTRTQNT